MCVVVERVRAKSRRGQAGVRVMPVELGESDVR